MTTPPSGPPPWPPPQPPQPPYWPPFQPPNVPYAPPPQWPPTEPAVKKSRTGWLIASVVVVTFLVAGGVLAYFMLLGGPKSTEREIRSRATSFAEAVDTDEQRKVLDMMCAEEADELLELDTWDPLGPQSPDPSRKKPIIITEVTVRGDVARAEFTRSDPPLDGALYFLKEDGAWKVCDSVSKQFDDEPN
ncbi:hypothetical protein [Mycolicibacterium fortuitum]|uniref:Rv0361 family membrane protein n=1 Tax=Mycolicibacterium fortuitum TaxID=1766 RepID=UPI000B08F2D5|nr:hypothetical protein [Mycolicibacterium fortuitum]